MFGVCLTITCGGLEFSLEILATFNFWIWQVPIYLNVTGLSVENLESKRPAEVCHRYHLELKNEEAKNEVTIMIKFLDFCVQI